MDDADANAYSMNQTVWGVVYAAEMDGRDIYSLNATEWGALDSTSWADFPYQAARQTVWNITTAQRQIFSGVKIGSAPHITCVVSSLAISKPGKHEPVVSVPNMKLPPSVRLEEGVSFSAYPNPTSGVVTFAYNVPQAANVRVVVTNVVGEKVAVLQSGRPKGKVYWDAGTFPPGVYLYQASYGGGVVANGKVVVVR